MSDRLSGQGRHLSGANARGHRWTSVLGDNSTLHLCHPGKDDWQSCQKCHQMLLLSLDVIFVVKGYYIVRFLPTLEKD